MTIDKKPVPEAQPSSRLESTDASIYGSLLLVDEHGSLVPAKQGGGIFFHLPVRDATGTARSFEPLVPEPPGSPAVPGVVDHEGPVAVGCDPGLITHLFDGADAMQHPPARWPQLDLFDQPEQLDPLSIEAFLRGFGLFAHSILFYSPSAALEARRTQRNISLKELGDDDSFKTSCPFMANKNSKDIRDSPEKLCGTIYSEGIVDFLQSVSPD